MRTIALLFLIPATLPAAAFRFRELNATSIELSENGRPVFVYNFGMMHKAGVPDAMERSSYLHPVYTPSGTIITDDFNPDHVHHRGISWMWPVVVVDGKTYDLWIIQGIRARFVRWTTRQGGDDSARLGVENGWFVGERKLSLRTWILSFIERGTAGASWSSRWPSKPPQSPCRSRARRISIRASADSASASLRATAVRQRL